jgi:hypothetical protein
MMKDDKQWKKLVKILGQDMIDELLAEDASALRQAIVGAERLVAALSIRFTPHEDIELAKAKESVNCLSAAYRDTIKFQRAKQRVASACLLSKGKES